jgi:hypothetical protein
MAARRLNAWIESLSRTLYQSFPAFNDCLPTIQQMPNFPLTQKQAGTNDHKCLI